MEKQNKKNDRFSKRLAFLYSIFIAFPVYGILGIAYYLDFLNGFVFLGTLLVIIAIALIILIIFRKNKFKRLILTMVLLLFILFGSYEMRLLSYDSHTYSADGYREPEELLEGSGIHILAVGLYDIHYMEDEDLIRENYEMDGIQIFDLYKIQNRDRYVSKTAEIKEFFRLSKDDFQVMGESVRSYLDEDIPSFNEFLSRENHEGDSAGLALGLTAMIHQGNLENKLTIGVTGTLERNGDVMEIGAIKAKMIISEQNNFPFIIVPLANKKEAEIVKSQHKLSLEILPVSHIDEAILIIKELNMED